MRSSILPARIRKSKALLSECVWHDHPSLKVIHGHGSGGGASRIKPQVLAALQKHAERLGAVMEQDGDNAGAHVLRFKQASNLHRISGAE